MTTEITLITTQAVIVQAVRFYNKYIVYSTDAPALLHHCYHCILTR